MPKKTTWYDEQAIDILVILLTQRLSNANSITPFQKQKANLKSSIRKKPKEPHKLKPLKQPPKHQEHTCDWCLDTNSPLYRQGNRVTAKTNPYYECLCNACGIKLSKVGRFAYFHSTVRTRLLKSLKHDKTLNSPDLDEATLKTLIDTAIKKIYGENHWLINFYNFITDKDYSMSELVLLRYWGLSDNKLREIKTDLGSIITAKIRESLKREKNNFSHSFFFGTYKSVTVPSNTSDASMTVSDKVG